MKKRCKTAKLLSFAFAALAVTCVLLATAFVRVSASDEVSPSDVVTEGLPEAREQDEHFDASPEEAGEIPEATSPVVRTVSVTREEKDFILSNQTGLKREYGTKYNKFLSSASYNGDYRSELTEKEKIIYDTWIQHTVVLKHNYTEPMEVVFDPPLTYDAPNCVPNEADPDQDYIADADVAFIDDMILSAAAAFFYDRPDVFWLRSFGYTIYVDLSKDAAGNITGSTDRIVISYTRGSYPGAYEDKNDFENGIAAAVASITQSRKNSCPYETVKAIHDYILLHAAYNYTALNGSSYTYGYAYSAAPLFVSRLNGLFVCEGYSKAMKILCNEFGINCALVSGTGMTSDTSGGPHMWCYVQLNGNWYAVDATWDDGYTDSDGHPCPMYNYFLVGSGTWVTNQKQFSKNHINDGQVMSSEMKHPLVFPSLSASMYDYYIRDADPIIDLVTLGGGIRLSEPYGMRFGIRIMKNEGLRSLNGVVDFGTLIIPTANLGDNELTIHTQSVRKIRAEAIYSQDDTQITFTGVLTNIPTTRFNTQISGRGYFIYTDNNTGEQHIVYSETIERTFFQVAQNALDKYTRIENPTQSDLNIIKKLNNILSMQ